MTDTLAVETQPPLGLVAQLAELSRSLQEVDWTQVAAHDLVSAAIGLEQARALQDSVRVAVASQVAASRAAQAEGWSSTADFLTAVGGGTKGSGPALLRLTERLGDLPLTAAGLSAGWLSLAKAQVIASRVASLPHDADLRAAAEQVLVESAAVLDASDLSRSWPQVLDRIDPDGSRRGREEALARTERVAHGERHLSFQPDDLGGVRWRGYSTVEDAEVVKSALMALAAPVTSPPGACGGDPSAQARQRARETGDSSVVQGTCVDPGCAHDGRDRRDGGARLLDAVVECCRRLQATDALPTSHGAPARMVVYTDLERLRTGLAGHPVLGPGTHVGGSVHLQSLSVEAVRRLACDAEIIPGVLGSAGQVLDVGRTQRLVTSAIWTALVARDRTCAFPGCSRLPLACDAHHVVHWADGGGTSLGNLVLLCRRHHTLVHQSGWRIRVDEQDGLPEFRPPTGPRRDTWVRQRRPHERMAC